MFEMNAVGPVSIWLAHLAQEECPLRAIDVYVKISDDTDWMRTRIAVTDGWVLMPMVFIQSEG